MTHVDDWGFWRPDRVAIACPTCRSEASWISVEGECDAGRYICSACGAWGDRTLDWPSDALLACEIRGERLWAWDRSHLSSHFLGAKVREEVVAAIDRVLAKGVR